MKKKAVQILVAAMIGGLFLTGCDAMNMHNQNTVSSSEISEDKVLVSNNILSQNIIINSAGFERNAPKGVVLDSDFAPMEFSVIRVDTEEEVFKNSISIAGENAVAKEDEGCYFLDLTDFSDEGEFYIALENGYNSDVFTVSDNLYKNILTERLDYFTNNYSDPKGYTTNTLSKCYMRITDRVLAQEIFGDVLSKEDDKDNIPLTLIQCREEIDTLKDCLDKSGNMKSTVSNDLKSQYQYSAVFALFAKEYWVYDNKYAKECLDISAKMFNDCEKKYGENKDTKVDDARFWAACQLYNSLGKKNYRIIAEGYNEDIPKGFSEEECGYFGCIAYLRSSYKTNNDISAKMMALLMNDAIEKANSTRLSIYKVEHEGEYDTGEVLTAFSNARLMVLANYISKSVDYIEVCENQLEFLYGRNPGGVDYAYNPQARYFNEPQTFILAGLIDSYIYE